MTEPTVWNRNTNTMKRETIIFCLLFTACRLIASVPDTVMKAIYNEVKTPLKYGLVVAPADNSHKIDCPMVYNEDGKWFMTYVVYNGSDGLNGRGYETWLATSTDLLHWTTLGSGAVVSIQRMGQKPAGGLSGTHRLGVGRLLLDETIQRKALDVVLWRCRYRL